MRKKALFIMLFAIAGSTMSSKGQATIRMVPSAPMNVDPNRPMPVRWTYSVKKTSANMVEVSLRAVIEKGWHIYSQHAETAGADATEFLFFGSADYATVGKTEEPKSPNGQYEHTVVFTQKIKLKTDETTIKGFLGYTAGKAGKNLSREQLPWKVTVE